MWSFLNNKKNWSTFIHQRIRGGENAYVLWGGACAVIMIFTLFSCQAKTKDVLEQKQVSVEKEVDAKEVLPTTFILLRHAEKVKNTSNPDLNTRGQQRAKDLSGVLKHASIDAIFSTDYKRTIQTVEPLANYDGLPIQKYNPSDLRTFAHDALSRYPSGTIVVVGHSNTTPALLNILTGTRVYSDFDEDEYDNLFIVTVFELGKAKVVQLAY